MVDSFLFFRTLLCAVQKKGVVERLVGIALACFSGRPGSKYWWDYH